MEQNDQYNLLVGAYSSEQSAQEAQKKLWSDKSFIKGITSRQGLGWVAPQYDLVNIETEFGALQKTEDGLWHANGR